jgi:hypothetical protein
MPLYIKNERNEVHEFPDSFRPSLESRCNSMTDPVRWATDAEVSAFLAEREKVYQQPWR